MYLRAACSVAQPRTPVGRRTISVASSTLLGTYRTISDHVPVLICSRRAKRACGRAYFSFLVVTLWSSSSMNGRRPLRGRARLWSCFCARNVSYKYQDNMYVALAARSKRATRPTPRTAPGLGHIDVRPGRASTEESRQLFLRQLWVHGDKRRQCGHGARRVGVGEGGGGV